MRVNLAAIVGAVMVGVVAPAGARTPATAESGAAPPAAAPAAVAQTEAGQQQFRYQIRVMERVLEQAVEHGASKTRDRLQKIAPAAMLLTDNAQVRGFRLEGYGVFFDVVVPDAQGALQWSFRTLDQNDLGLESALKTIKAHIDAANDVNLEQALKRVELQLGPLPVTADLPQPGARNETGSPAVAQEGAQGAPQDSIMSDPDEAYRGEVRKALMDAMLDYSGPLAIGPDEWLTIAARRSDERPRLAPGDDDAHTMIIRIHGADLAAFRAARISRDEALKRMEVRLF
ncbi:MAG: hypothetical protein ACM3SQ_17475 [Betaproteobacteria bacterium]